MVDEPDDRRYVEELLKAVTGRRFAVEPGHGHAVCYMLTSHVIELFHRRGLGREYDGIAGLHRFVVAEGRELPQEERWAVLHVARMCEDRGLLSEGAAPKRGPGEKAKPGRGQGARPKRSSPGKGARASA